MKKLSNKIKILILSIFLLIFSIIFIFINRKTCTIKIETNNNISNVDNFNIEIKSKNELENENLEEIGTDIIKIIDKKSKNNIFYLNVEAVSEGKSFIIISDENQKFYNIIPVYVHKFGIITYDSYFGNSNGNIVIPICITILFFYILYLLIKSFIKNARENIYQYKNIAYLGIIIFLSFSLINQIFTIINYKGIINTIETTINMCSAFSTILLPIAFITSILVIISNIVLIKKEGFSFKNILGLMFGLCFCFCNIVPFILDSILDSATWIDVHNIKGIALYLQEFIILSIYVVISYLECILLSTIILSIKSARHIPKFNKDFILILGCQIRKDGTLTNLLKGRVDRAIEFRNMQKEHTGKDLTFIASGGKGADEVTSEAQAIKNYLLKNGINENNIIIEDKSKNTFENIKFSNNIINKRLPNAKIAFSTTNYHVFRAGIMATIQNISIEGIGSKTKSYFWINAFIREFIATIFSEKKKHILIIFFIIILSLFLIFLLYLSYIL